MALIDRRDDWTTHPSINIPRDPSEVFLKGLTIVIDPGHGGTDGGNVSTRPAAYKAGRGGEREANINLRVALILERLLKEAGVNIILTRHGDDTLSLSERSAVANNVVRPDGGVGADLFVSIHHNAGSRTANFTSTFYHGDIDDCEPDADVARYLCFELARQMRTQHAKTAPIFSSFLMYDTGFGVLRTCNVPAVLLECSFFSEPDEEKRLIDPTYNLREAYAIYLGLCQWAYCGRPTQTTPQISRGLDGQLVLTTTLNEGLPRWWGVDRNRIVSSTVRVTLDGLDVQQIYNESTRTLHATLPSTAANGQHVVTIHHANFLKNHNWPQRYELATGSDGQIHATTLPAYRGRAIGTPSSTGPSTRPRSR